MERFVVWAVPPPGVAPIPAEFKMYKNNSTFPTPQMNFYFSGDTIFVEFDATNPFFEWEIRYFCTVFTGLYCAGRANCDSFWVCA